MADLVEATLRTDYPDLAVALQSEPFPPAGVHLAYGTAGFRTRAELLDSTFLRMGMLATLRSRYYGGAAVGLMVTASHNPERDNGIKMVDCDGGMLAQSWEGYAITLANAPPDQAMATLTSVIASILVEGATNNVSASQLCTPNTGTVYIGLDTRAHSPKLASLAAQGARLMGATVCEIGIVTTPQLHHVVRMTNIGNGISFSEPTGVHQAQAKQWASVQGYYDMLADAYLKLIGSSSSVRPIIVDASCGVGGVQLPNLINAINDKASVRGPAGVTTSGSNTEGTAVLSVTLLNNVGEGELNEDCGAEFVQKGRQPPSDWEADSELKGQLLKGNHLCSIDGDGDRLVYHYFDANGEWHLLDGDKCAVLLAEFISDELSRIQGLGEEVQMAMVQTAYANGASADYAKQRNIKLDFAKTGVKFVHHTADKYDIGVYFEANGHGTALIKGKIVDQLKQVRESSSDSSLVAVERLLALHQLINQAVGDAMSDMLAIEAVLCLKGWSIEQWDACYQDLPSRQLKLPVRDRSVIVCSDDETFVIEPAALQIKLSEAQSKHPAYRCFVRPSGTEDVVRVYAEAPTVAEANQLAYEASLIVYEMAGGVGEPPVPL